MAPVSRFLVLLAYFATSLAATVIDTANYTIWTIPDGKTDTSVSTTLPGAALIGGGADCVPAFEWMVSNANGGDFVILRASGDDDYNEFVYGVSVAAKKTLNSVTTILFKNRDASFDDTVLQLLKNAEAIFFAGGDQSIYLKFWGNTPVQLIIQEKLMSNTTIGGTSAGLAIQGHYIYSAEVGSVYSDECMENPYNKFVTIADALLQIPYLQNVITDTHFSVRDRMGRFLTFMSRISTDNKDVSTIHGIAVDETTALLLDINTGAVRTVGSNHAFVCSSSAKPAVCLPDTPLTFKNVDCVKLTASTQDSFSLATWTGQGVRYTNSIVQGHYTADTKPYGPQ